VEIVNETPLPAAFQIGKIDTPRFSLTMIVKGTFDLKPGGVATPSEEMLYPTGDEPYPDDPEALGSPRYASDFAPYKLRADLLLVGSCHVPEARPRGRCRVRFEVGGRGPMLDVWGDREWAWSGLRRRPTDPVPFQEMELRYERAFGGRRRKRNPIGIGHRSEPGPDGRRVRRVPNLEDPARPLRSRPGRRDPAGFGPLGATWKQRRSKAGTYRRRWRRERWPWLPEDFDWSYFNAAPAGMQIPYLRGDETLLLENLHPEHPRLESRLPGLRVRSFLCDRGPGQQDSGFREIPMRLDTLWVDAETLQLVLVWRGHADVASVDHEDLSHVYVRSEPLEEVGPDLAQCEALLVQRIAEEAAEEEIDDVEPDEEAADREGAAAVEAAAEREQAALREDLAAAGVDVDAGIEPTPEAQAEEARLRASLGMDVPEDPAIDREEVLRRVAAGEALADVDLGGLDLSAAPLRGADLAEAILTGANLTGADLADARLAGADLSDAILTNAVLTGAKLDEADLTGADLRGADLSGASAREATFERARLDGAVLTGMDATDATFEEASLAEAVLSQAVLKGADLSEALLERAVLDGACLREAYVEGVRGTGARLDGADLTDLRAAGCDFSHGSLRGVTGADSVWDGARLSGADFSYARLDGADFSSAELGDATLHAASLKQGRFERAGLVGANASQSNLFEASFGESDLTRADLRGANLYGADLLQARVDGTRFEGANLRRARRDP